MDEPRKIQVSLRGASVREITRDALLQKVSQERDLRHYAKRASVAAIFIQRVWRRYKVAVTVALQLQEEWEKNFVDRVGSLRGAQISSSVLRPFLFFTTCLATRHKRFQTRDLNGNWIEMLKGLTGLYRVCCVGLSQQEDQQKNFCFMAISTPEERKIWNHQSRKLISLCLFILGEFDQLCTGVQEVVAVTSLAMRLAVLLTDPEGWKNIADSDHGDVDIAAKDLVRFMGTDESGLYISVRRYINTLDFPFSSQVENVAQKDDKVLITASAITLALQPLQVTSLKADAPSLLNAHYATDKHCISLFTIPWLVQRLPTVLVRAMKHKSTLIPCLQALLILKERILNEMWEIDQLKVLFCPKVIPPVGWALASIICLATGGENGSFNSGWLYQGLDCVLYVHVVIILAEDLLARLENVGYLKKENQEGQSDHGKFANDITICKHEPTHGSFVTSYVDLFKPVCQQRHLTHLLAIMEKDAHTQGSETLSEKEFNYSGKLEFIDIAYFNSYLLRIVLFLNPTVGRLPVLNMLSFAPGFLVNLWGALESILFPGDGPTAEKHHLSTSKSTRNKKDGLFEKKEKHGNKDESNKWVSVLNKFTGKSQWGSESTSLVDDQSSPSQINKDSPYEWDIKPLKHGPEGISKDLSCLLHLFCATYSHLLLILDDIEFYEKQVPFRIEQQRRIASVLHTFVYNGLSNGFGQQTRPLMDSAIRCLHLMYARDCRHQFCPSVLWLSPGRKSRPPIAIAARTHEVLSGNARIDDASALLSMGSVITTVPHVMQE